ncbi:grass carp reovirus (GCRV)-induced gene 2q [Alosa sapidissima]|uniref:grass carp reovirus (GCRV)-induced gene 2q n=1 Tax=Alosa sapidissima TaxID=34773 RepID=UPI001C08752A|nr:grass carp reovirus (GCRV)-induced gene 2q [Alosa sapidissima]
MLGPGVYVSRSFAKTACYPRGSKGQKRAVLKLSVRVGRVKMIDRQGHHLQKSWHQAGYDTAWVPPNCGMVKSGCQENCVWDPKRIRVLSVQSNNRESNDDESTDEDDEGDNYDDEEEGDDEDYDEDHKEESDDEEEDDDDDDDETDNSSHESREEENSVREGGVSGDEFTHYYGYVNAQDASPDHVDDRSSDDDDDDDEASDKEGFSCGESGDAFTKAGARESSGESRDNDYTAKNHMLMSKRTLHKAVDFANSCIYSSRGNHGSFRMLFRMNLLLFIGTPAGTTMNKALEVSGPHHASESNKVQEDHCMMYHGTTLRAARRIQRFGFIPSTDGSLGRGVYVSRSFEKATHYPGTTQRGQRLAILKLRVCMGKVLEIKGMDHSLRKSWHKEGYDAAWIPATGERLEEHCIWDPKQITVLNIITADHNNCFVEPPSESSL